MKRYRILFLFVLCLVLQLSSTAETLKGEIEKVWTVDSARQEAFKNLKPWIDLSWAPAIDPNLIENKQAINNHKREIKDRIVSQYSNGNYSIWILDDDNYDKVYYYFPSGELFAIDFTIFPENIKNLQDFLEAQQNNKMFPIKNYKHAYPGGKIVNITLTVGNKNAYMFEPSGELDDHWIGDACYDLNGNIILTRNKSK